MLRRFFIALVAALAFVTPAPANLLLLGVSKQSIVPLSLVFNTSGVGTTSGNFTIPAGALVGDLCVVSINTGSTTATATPAGWTNAVTTPNPGSQANGRIIFKVLVGGEPGSVVNLGGGTPSGRVMACFTPNIALTSVTAVSPNFEVTTSLPATQTITVAAQAAPVIIIGSAYHSGGTAVESGTLPTNGVVIAGGTLGFNFYYEIQNVTPTDRTLGTNDTGTNILQSVGLVAT